MTELLRTVSLFAACSALAVSTSPVLPAQSEPPIRIVIDIHMDPMHAYPAAARPLVYQRWVDDTDSLLDIIEPHGAQISFLSCGRQMGIPGCGLGSQSVVSRAIGPQAGQG